MDFSFGSAGRDYYCSHLLNLERMLAGKLVPSDTVVKHLVNLHFHWADDEISSQEHYTGVRDLIEFLIITLLF